MEPTSTWAPSVVSEPYLDDGDVVLHLGDCVEVMAAMEPVSVDAIVCDPPYGLEFMGKDWDALGGDTRQVGDATFHAPHLETNTYGGAKIRYGGSAYGNRNAGREMQEWHLAWATEALRVLKPGGHLLAFGGSRTFHRLTCAIEDAGFEVRDCLSWLYGSGFPKSLDVSKAIDKAAGAEREVVGRNPNYRDPDTDHHARWNDAVISPDITAPATPEAAAWEGWGTALKPAWEPCVMARKPLTGTVAAGVLEHGTGAINVDGCRMAAERWPANVVLDEAAAERLDAEVGERSSGARAAGEYGGIGANSVIYGEGGATRLGAIEANTGGPSRFFYTAKASSAERDGATHPTVKPLALMRWLVRMVTPPGGLVLDPFAGSGTTLLAARQEHMRAIGIEQSEEYADMAAHRLRQLGLF